MSQVGPSGHWVKSAPNPALADSPGLLPFGLRGELEVQGSLSIHVPGAGQVNRAISSPAAEGKTLVPFQVV